MARKRKNNPKKIRVKKQIGGAAALGAMNRVARENLAKLDEINQSSQPPRTPGYTPPAPRPTPAPQPIMRPDIVRPGTKTGRPDVGAALSPTPAPTFTRDRFGMPTVTQGQPQPPQGGMNIDFLGDFYKTLHLNLSKTSSRAGTLK